VYPVLDLGFLGITAEVGTYRVALWVGAVLGVLTAALLARSRGLPLRAATLALLTGVLGVPVGARALHAIVNPSVYASDPAALFALNPSGFALYGGLLVGVAAGVAAARALRLDVWRLADAAAAGVAVGVIVIRLGCFGRGCCFGVPSNVAWAVAFPMGSPAHLTHLAAGKVELFANSLPVHPTQLYEAAGALIGLALLLALGVAVRKGRIPDGVPALGAAAWFTVVRWLDWGLREHPSSLAAPSWVYPGLMYAAILLTCGFGVVWLQLRARRTQ
jgi:phosphatidylglycerol:prolipoprotein diacylglycerol transferase